jgi:NADPH:quinone reductase
MHATNGLLHGERPGSRGKEATRGETSMEALQLERYGGPLVVRRIPVPRPGRGEVLIRLAAAPINPSDLGFLAGSYAAQRPLPAVPGFEGSGTVVAAGPGLLPRLLAGRRVSRSPRLRVEPGRSTP